jgi:hypothetical protein
VRLHAAIVVANADPFVALARAMTRAARMVALRIERRRARRNAAAVI